MPDMETLVSSCVGGGTDSKVKCETLADNYAAENLPDHDDLAVADVPQDFPPESFWLSKDAELDWFDRNAFFERKESGKGISNSTNLSGNQSSNSNSQRFSKNLKSKSSYIGFPKAQKTNYLDSRRRTNKPTAIHLFPKRSQSAGKSSVSVVEPSSPKVSCMGRVRSKRGRRRSCENNKKRGKPVEQNKTGGHDRKKSFCSRVLSIFKANSDKTNRKSEELTVEEAPRRSAAVRMREFPASAEPVAEPPALGGMKKFSSGRRSGSGSTDDFDVIASIQSRMNGSH